MKRDRYNGGKGNVWQHLVNQAPPHHTLIETHLGSGALTRNIRPAARNIGIDRDPAALDYFRARCTPSQLTRVELHEGRAEDFLRAWSFTGGELVYADPPYPRDTRTYQGDLYRFEMTDEEHRELLRLLKSLPCAVMISSYWSELYASELQGWRMVNFQTVKSNGQAASEWLWCNFPDPAETGLLHDYAHVGMGWKAREDIREQKSRIIQRLQGMPTLRREAVLAGVAERFGLRRQPTPNLGLLEAPQTQGDWPSGIPTPTVGRRDPLPTLREAAAPGRLPRIGEAAGGEPPRLVKDRGSQTAALSPVNVRPTRDGAASLVNMPGSRSGAGSLVALSVFCGLDLLGRGFRETGFSVVRGPEIMWGDSIESFHPPAGLFPVVFGGSPCQGFSTEMRGRKDHVYERSMRLLKEFGRVVYDAQPECWLLENVPAVPDLAVSGYHVQRFALTDVECGGQQRRLRHFQFGSRAGWILRPERLPKRAATAPAVLATDSKRRRDFADACELQGLPRDFYLEGFGVSLNYKLVGNAVPLTMARVVAQAVRAVIEAPEPPTIFNTRVCECGCGETPVAAKVLATPACRWRVKNRRDGKLLKVSWPE